MKVKIGAILTKGNILLYANSYGITLKEARHTERSRRRGQRRRTKSGYGAFNMDSRAR